jgi:uncharacterized protein
MRPVIRALERRGAQVTVGRLGAVDERLIAEGRLRRLARAEDVRVVKRDGPGAGTERVRRDPELFCDLLVGGLVRADRG